MKNLVKNFARNESGATAIEYGLIAVLISVVVIAAMTTVGSDLNAAYGKISEGLQKAS